MGMRLPSFILQLLYKTKVPFFSARLPLTLSLCTLFIVNDLIPRGYAKPTAFCKNKFMTLEMASSHIEFDDEFMLILNEKASRFVL